MKINLDSTTKYITKDALFYPESAL